MNTVLIEFIEIYILQVLYLRAIYPKQIFRKQKSYNLAVFTSIYPPLNSYLNLALRNIAEIKGLVKIEILIYGDDDSYESFVINMLDDIDKIEDSETLINLNEQFRECLHNLHVKCKALEKLKRPSKFKLLLHTNEKTYQELCSNSKHQDFLWIKFSEDDKLNKSRKSCQIVPILSSASNQKLMSLHIEKF